MRITLLGTGAGMPEPGRSQSSLLIEDRGLKIIMDCGAGTLLRMSQAGVDPTTVDAVFISHLHLDHVSDLLGLTKARLLMGQPRLRVWGPLGTYEWFQGLIALFPYLKKCQVSIQELVSGDETRIDDLTFRCTTAVHSVPTLALRAEGSAVVTYSGDTEPCHDVSKLARGSDLLIHECSFPEPTQVTNHSTPIRLGRTLRDVDRICLTHFYPQCRGREEEMASQVAEGSGIRVEAGRDLQSFEL